MHGKTSIELLPNARNVLTARLSSCKFKFDRLTNLVHAFTDVVNVRNNGMTNECIGR